MASRKKADSGRENDLSKRRAIVDMDPSVMLDSMIEIQNEFQSDRSNITEEARNYVTQSIAPILACLNSHYGGGKEAFLKDWETRNFRRSKFKSMICNGGSNCTLQTQ